ncbi:hypothetical protein ACFE04_019214 [Oxalis oulophora]
MASLASPSPSPSPSPCKCCYNNNSSLSISLNIKRPRFITFSSSSSNTNNNSHNSKPKHINSLTKTTSTTVNLITNKPKSLCLKLNPVRFKSLFGPGSFSRKILFASKKIKGVILLNLITIVYASCIPVVKEVEATVDPAAFTVVRFAVSAIPFIPFIYRARKDVSPRNAGIELGFWVSLGYLMQALGLLTSDAGRAAFISMFTVIVVPFLDGMLGAIIPTRTWFGALMSIIGVGMLESSGSPPCVGDLLNFLSAIFFGVHMLRTEHISRRTSRKDFLPLLGYEVCVLALFSTIWYLVGGWFGTVKGFDPSSWTWDIFLDWMVTFPWIPAIYTGIFSTGLCLWVEMTAMRDVSATETAIIYGLEPVWGASFAWFLLGERWGPAGWIGAALVLGGSLTVQLLGSSSNDSKEGKKRTKKLDPRLVSDKPNSPSASPVMLLVKQHLHGHWKNLS